MHIVKYKRFGPMKAQAHMQDLPVSSYKLLCSKCREVQHEPLSDGAPIISTRCCGAPFVASIVPLAPAAHIVMLEHYSQAEPLCEHCKHQTRMHTKSSTSYGWDGEYSYPYEALGCEFGDCWCYVPKQP